MKEGGKEIGRKERGRKGGEKKEKKKRESKGGGRRKEERKTEETKEERKRDTHTSVVPKCGRGLTLTLLTQHDVFGDSLHVIALAVRRRLHEDVDSLLEGAAHQTTQVLPVDSVTRDGHQMPLSAKKRRMRMRRKKRKKGGAVKEEDDGGG